MEPQGTETSFDLLKFILVFASIPLWAPFAKALWDEFRLALRPDGGLAGYELTRKQRADIERDIQVNEDLTQIHEPVAHLRYASTTGPRSQATRAGAKAPSRRLLGPQPGTQRRSFTQRGEGSRTPTDRPRFR